MSGRTHGSEELPPVRMELAKLASVPFVHQHRLADGCARGHIGQDPRRLADWGALGDVHPHLA